MIDLKKLKPDIRHLIDMKELIYDREWFKTAPSELELYYMYRDLAENNWDKEKIINFDLRYDITILNPVMLGREFNKTAGHDHPIVPGTDITYAEIYEVLEGEVVFLLQDSDENEIKDVFAIKAKAEDKIIMPPNYEHIMINVSDKPAKTCNWICRRFDSNIYKPFRAMHGFCYYVIKNNNEIEWIENENYKSIPSLKWQEPNNLFNLDIPTNKPIYNLVNDLEKLNFLKSPQNYTWK